MGFDGVIGQNKIKMVLLDSIRKDQVGHAYVFTGPVGIGKRTMARLFAGMLLCSGFNDDGRCGRCVPCELFSAGSSPDFHEVSVEGASIGIDEIRKLQKDISIKPMYSSRKLYLIPDAEQMTVQAQNCLLKTLEEPPPHSMIILTTSNYDSLLDTVRSRISRYSFMKNTLDEVCRVLEMNSQEGRERIRFIASYADGVIGRALELANSEEFIQLRDKTAETVFRISGCGMREVFEIYKLYNESRDSIDTVLDIMVSFYRDLLIIKSMQDENRLINFDKRDIILNNASRFSTSELVRGIDIIESTKKKLKQNANYQLTIEIMLLKLQEEFCNG